MSNLHQDGPRDQHQIAASGRCPGCGAAITLHVAQAGGDNDDETPLGLKTQAKRKKVCLGTLRRWVKEGELPAKVGARGAWLVRGCDIDAVRERLPDVQIDAANDDDEDEVERLRRGA